MEQLISKIKKMQNPTVAGLDPKLSYIPSHILDNVYKNFGKTPEAVTEALCRFNFGLIDALSDIVPAVKPQMAYYEMYGLAGLVALKKTMDYAKSKGMYIILDGKRNDIGSTAESYAEAYLGKSVIDDTASYHDFDADSLTVNAYLGTDGIMPFVKKCKENGKGIFCLVKTSNPSSGELQDLNTCDAKIYEKMAELVNKWGEETIGESGYSAVGAVVGATYPEQAEKLRKIMPKAYFLVPGYGAQGGTAKDVAKSFNSDGLGAIVNSSRGIMCAYQKKGLPGEAFKDAAREEAILMRDAIMNEIK